MLFILVTVLFLHSFDFILAREDLVGLVWNVHLLKVVGHGSILFSSLWTAFGNETLPGHNMIQHNPATLALLVALFSFSKFSAYNGLSVRDNRDKIVFTSTEAEESLLVFGAAALQHSRSNLLL